MSKESQKSSESFFESKLKSKAFSRNPSGFSDLPFPFMSRFLSIRLLQYPDDQHHLSSPTSCFHSVKKVAGFLSHCSSSTVFENHPKSRIRHCERSELRLHFEWAKVNQKLEACCYIVLPDRLLLICQKLVENTKIEKL